MCGISGIITSGAPVDGNELRAMSARLAHRGPDDQGAYLGGPVGLAHNRLSIIDLSGGHQPIISPETGNVLVANGEIYNYLELNGELASAGHRFITRSDSETILRAYEAWGLDALKRLNGMFAFALYDRATRQLVLARDRLGIKPLYLLRRPGKILFGSEMKALIPHCAPPEISPESLAQYLAYDHSSGSQTLVKGIERLAPGQAMIFKPDLTSTTIEYWSPTSVTPRRGDYEELSTEFDGLMDQVMGEHLRADVPFGLFLSGGVDSSLLLAQIARHQSRPVRTFSVGFGKADHSGELAEAEAAAALYPTEHTSLRLDEASLLRRLPHTIWASDDLILDLAQLPTSLLAQATGRELKVVFTGEGGDESFGGYGRYRRPAAVRALNALLAPGTGGYRTRRRWPWRESRRAFSKPLRDARNAEQAALKTAWRETPREWTTLMRCQYSDLRTTLTDSLCPKVDRMLMAFGLEGRVPFLDHRIVEFGLSLPDELKIAPHRGKLFLKRWGQQFFSSEHLERPKRGFTVPAGRMLEPQCLKLLSERLPRHPAIQPWFHPAGIAGLFEKQRKSGKATYQIWALMQLAIWHTIFIERDGAPPPVDAELADWL